MKKNMWLLGWCLFFFGINQNVLPGNSKNVAHLGSNIELINNATPEKAEHYFLYLSASYQHARGNVAEALKTYQHLLHFNPSQQVYTGFFQLLSDLGQYQTIVKLYEAHQKTFVKAFEKNVMLNLIIAQAYVSTDQDTKAESIFLKLAKENPDNEQVAYFSAMAYVKNNQLEKALTFVNQCLENQAIKQRFFLFHFLKSKILVQQEKLPAALAEIEKSLTLFPKFDRGILFKAMLLEQLGQVNDAIKGYKRFLDLVGQDPTVEKQIVQLLFSQQRFSEALTYLKHIKNKSPDYFFDVALVEFKAGNMEKALEAVEQTLTLAPTFSKARLLKVEILLAAKNTSALLSFMHDWLIADINNPSVLQTFLLLRKTAISTKKIIKTLQDVERTNPHLNILAAIADLSTEANNNKQAIAYYEKILATTTDPLIKSKTRFQIGYLYFTTKEHDKLEKTLEQALSCTPVYPSVYNLLAFHYAQTNKKLPQALELVEKALSFAPHCYYYLDTKANVLLLLGRKSEALNTFQKALSIAPEDKVIQAHLKQAQEGQ